MTYGSTKIEELIGKTFVSVSGKQGDERMEFKTADGSGYCFYHSQDCCESVSIDDVCGDLSDLEGSPILSASEEISKNKNPDGVNIPEYQDSFTWTFYKFATIKGSVTVRWYGKSNGYYSEQVSLGELLPLE